jgi:hypothetical protein
MEATLSNAAKCDISVVPVRSAAQWRAFHRLPHTLYRSDPNWVPPLLIERKTHFQPAHNAFFQHAKADFWLALKDGEPAGRITAQIDHLHIQQHNDATGHFGFLEATDDAAVFAALLAQGEKWLKGEGMKRVLGPVSFNMWDEPGLLVDGFDTPPNVMMGHHLPYYQHRIVEQGYRSAQDVLAYERALHQPFGETLEKMIAKGRKKHEFRIRPIRMDKKSLPGEIDLIRNIINDAWSDNWGFVPITTAEIEEIANLFKLFLKPDALVIGEYDGEPAGVAMILPNINETIWDLKGKLFPFGFIKMLWRLKVTGVKSGRLALMGVLRKYRTSPAGAILALLMIQANQKSDFARTGEKAELSWILDSNEPIKRMLEAFGCKITKRYRIYEKTIG